jgi:magnesium transporter
MATPEPTPSGLMPLAQLRFESAAEHVTTGVPRAAPGDAAGAVRERLVGRRFDSVAEIAVCEGERLVGLVNVEHLLAAPADTPIRELMDPDPPVVAPGVDQELAAWTAVRRGESSLAVVDESGRFIGLVGPQRLVEVLLWEHDEDMHRLVGILSGGSTARLAAEASVLRSLWHRVPWLLIGLGGALLAADLMGLFHAHLEHHLLVAFFIPGVVYLADAVGTQTETLMIRGLSVGVPIARAARRELLTGALIGVSLGALALPLAWLRWGQADVALAVSLALAIACSVATLIGMALPWLLSRLGIDPAYGSGPLATVIQDLLSVAIYLLLALAIVH